MTVDEGIDYILYTDDTCCSPEKLFNKGVISDGHSLVVLSQVTTLSDQVIHDLLRWVADSDVVLDLEQ